MSEIDLDAIQARAERVAEWRKAFHAPQNSMDYSQRDVPALLAVVRSQQAKIERVRRLAESASPMQGVGGMYSGIILADHVLAALTATEGAA